VIDEQQIRPAYDGSSTAFRALEGGGWGELVNLGYYPWYLLPGVLLGLGPFQRLLAKKSIALVEPRAGLRVLDAGCGRGATTAMLARSGCEALGIDLLPENVAGASAKYGEIPGARYAVADATQLSATAAGSALAPGSFDAVHCLEVAFHFGPQGRREFLAESFRVLRRGGRLVLVDFVWRDAHPEAIERIDAKRLVRDTWCFDEFEPLERYRANAAALGFRERAIHDWTGPVINRFQRIAQTNSRLGTSAFGRLLLRTFRPGYARMSAGDWTFLVELMRAHDAVRRASRYVAMVFEKPRMRSAAGALLVAALALTGTARADQAWQPLLTQDGVSVEERSVPGRELPELRATVEIDAAIFEVLAVIADVPRQSEWVHDCTESRLIRTLGPDAALIYNRNSPPWPASNRDAVLRSELKLVEASQRAAVEFANTDDPSTPPLDGVVRMQRLVGGYDLVALGPARTRVTYRVDVDPGGSLPIWLVTRTSRDMPLQTLLGLRRQVSATRGAYPAFVADWAARR